MKKLLLVLAALGLMAQFSACTANKAQDDAEFVENADVDKIEAEEPKLDDGSAQASTGEDQSLSTDSSLEAALGEAPTDTTASNDNLSLDAAPQDPPPTDIAAAPTLDENSLEAPPSDVPAEPPADSLAASDLPPQDNMNLDDPNSLAPADDSLNAAMNEPSATPQDTTTAMTPPPAAKVEAPIEATPTQLADVKPTTTVGSAGTTSLKKVSDATPYAYGDGFVNTIYIARPKEKLKDISMTIYGSDKTKELKQINKFLKARAPRAGDKIAYVSPNRPTDSSKTITYYEDTGMIPETYVAQKGDNLRKVSKKLLGYDNAWKEVWSTNAIESKSKLAEGETFKYWKSPASITPPTTTAATEKTPESAVQNIVQNNPAPPPPAAEMTPPPQPPAMNDLPPPPPQADLPPPPADAMAANATPPPPPADPALDAAMPPPPPPDDSQFAQTPPPPPPDSAMKHSKAPAGEEGEDVTAEGSNDTMTMLGIGVLLFGALAFVLVKRKKAQASRAHGNDAQMGEGLGT